MRCVRKDARPRPQRQPEHPHRRYCYSQGGRIVRLSPWRPRQPCAYCAGSSQRSGKPTPSGVGAVTKSLPFDDVFFQPSTDNSVLVFRAITGFSLMNSSSKRSRSLTERSLNIARTVSRCLPSFSVVSPDAARVVFLVEASIIALCAASIFTKIGQQFFRHGVCDTGQFKVINIFERGPNSWTGKSLGLCRRA